ncbi:MAG: radical SAM protein [Candidatus Schekmanbacteria bacterium]|nr:radical SAM protein [Candidatus Schekmanbacteria bacterium]
MKVFLGNAPWTKEGFYGVRAGSRWPHFEKEESEYMPFPFFLAYAAALLEKNSIDVRLVDGIANRDDDKKFFKKLTDYAPDIVVFEVSTNSIDIDLKFAEMTKKMLGENVPVVFCGPDMNMYKASFLENIKCVDIVLKGEYEFTLLEMVQHLDEKKDLNSVEGLFFRDRNGKVIFTGERKLVTDLDLFPWPARHQLQMGKYNDTPGNIPKPSVQMWASRGCPFKCIFCSWPQIMYGGNSYRTRNPVDVVNEMAWLVNEKGFKSIYFDDDTFNIGKKRIISICDEIKKKGLKVPWAIMARADTSDREMLEAMVDAGLYALKYGIESGVQDIVKVCGKDLDLAKAKENIRITKELGIKIHLTFAFGLPGETMDTIKRTVDFAIEQDPDSLQFSIITPFPGSRYFEDLDRKGFILSKNWEEYDGYNRAVIRTEMLDSCDLESGLRYANKSWIEHHMKKDMKVHPWKYIIRGIVSPFHGAKRFWELFAKK